MGHNLCAIKSCVRNGCCDLLLWGKGMIQNVETGTVWSECIKVVLGKANLAAASDLTKQYVMLVI